MLFQHWSFAYSGVIKPITPEIRKTIPKSLLITKLRYEVIFSFSQTKERTLDHFVLMLLLGFMLFIILEKVLHEKEKS